MDEKRKRMGAMGWTAVALALLIAYPLSFGPVTWMALNGMIPDWTGRTYQIIYRPISWGMIRSPAFNGLMSWYLGLWFPDPPP